MYFASYYFIYIRIPVFKMLIVFTCEKKNKQVMNIYYFFSVRIIDSVQILIYSLVKL